MVILFGSTTSSSVTAALNTVSTQDIMDVLKPKIEEALDNIFTDDTMKQQIAETVTQAIVDAINSNTSDFATAIMNGITNALTSIQDTLGTSIANVIKATLVDLVPTLQQAVADLATQATTFVKDEIVSGVQKGLQNADIPSLIEDALKQGFTQADIASVITEAFKNINASVIAAMLKDKFPIYTKADLDALIASDFQAFSFSLLAKGALLNLLANKIGQPITYKAWTEATVSYDCNDDNNIESFDVTVEFFNTDSTKLPFSTHIVGKVIKCPDGTKNTNFSTHQFVAYIAPGFGAFTFTHTQIRPNVYNAKVFFQIGVPDILKNFFNGWYFIYRIPNTDGFNSSGNFLISFNSIIEDWWNWPPDLWRNQVRSKFIPNDITTLLVKLDLARANKFIQETIKFYFA